VELPDDSESGQRDLGEYRTGKRKIGVGVKPRGEGVHLLTPRPKRTARCVRSAA
jgi:hypothetical protein